MREVKIFTTPTCVYCKMTKNFFEKNNVAYTEYNVATDEAARKEMIEKSGQMGVPVTIIDQKDVVIGFDPQTLSGLLGITSTDHR